MIKDGRIQRLLISTAILLLRAIAPVSIAYCCVRLLLLWLAIQSPLWLLPVDIFAGAEALFYLVVYLPRKHYLNRSTNNYNALSTPELRRHEFLQVWDAIYDGRSYISGWFAGAPFESLRREDIKDFLSCNLWNTTTRSPEDEDELQQYLEHTEEVLNWKFPPGRSKYESMKVMFEPLNIRHRPLTWYIIVAITDLQSWVTLKWRGFRHYRLSLPVQLFGSFPFRPWTVLSTYRSSAAHISYWYYPSSDASKLPIVFVHGIGIGLHFYLPFFAQLRAENPGVGIIAIEILHVSSRMNFSPPAPAEVAGEIVQIIQQQKIDRCVLLTHSYGSAIAAQLLQNPIATKLIHHTIFVDPVSFSFHTPHVVHTFLRRGPPTAYGLLLGYFSSTDADVQYTLTRGFSWPKNSLWRSDVENRVSGGKESRTTVMLGGKDLITDSLTLGRYLTRRQDNVVKWYDQPQPTEDDDKWMQEEWTGTKQLEVIWCPDLNHAEPFEDVLHRGMIIQVLKAYTESS